jgi:hypothetical protein
MARALPLWCLLIPGTALAKAASDVPYSVAEVYSAGLRFVRVDEGCKVVDRDPEAAFVTFECKDDDKVKRGSLEVFHSQVNGREAVRVQFALGDDPHYVELRWLELLQRKLRDERGTPPPLSPTAPPKKPPPDGGAPPTSALPSAS